MVLINIYNETYPVQPVEGVSPIWPWFLPRFLLFREYFLPSFFLLAFDFRALIRVTVKALVTTADVKGFINEID